MAAHDAGSSATAPLSHEEKFELRGLMRQMQELSSTTPASKRIVRQTAHDYAGHRLVSWKCNEFLYKKDPCPLPTRARGLFTCGEGGEVVIAARGYDKFFNIGEVAKTKWEWIEANTRGPYELTVKENGCLILAAGIDEGRTLLVTSKHAVNVPHADVGMKWVHHHLGEAGRSAEELAGFLHENNATAVFELCDDEFEEHILEYSDRTRGLYLHGINRNATELDTWPSVKVTDVAERFGFHVTKYFTFGSAAEGREFADKVRRDHVLDGRAIEGFVVRCRTAADDRPFMFKIKYDEPYLLFREWREVTNRIIGEKPFRTNYPLTKHYAAWVKQQLKSNPDDFAQFGRNKGIVGARKRFLEYHQAGGGSRAEVYEQKANETKVLLMPVATVGCGKTTVSLALASLFGFGHVQNDNITVKKNPRGAFHRAVMHGFDGHAFVIADRMNHMPDMRLTLTTAVREELVNCRIVALYWSHDGAPDEKILEKTVARVIGRGEAHQSLTPKRTPDFRGIMRGNLARFAPLDLDSTSDGLVEDVIELDPLADSAANLQKAVDGLCDLFPDVLTRPSAADMARALDLALAYKPTVLKDVGAKAKAKDKAKQKPQFFGLVSHKVDIKQKLNGLLDSGSGADWDICRRLMATGDHNRPLHITLAHVAAAKIPRAKAIYDAYMELPKKTWFSGAAVVECAADYIVCNGSVMALRVRSITAREGIQLPASVACQSGVAPGKTSLEVVNAIPHITLCVGTDGKAVQSNDMLATVFGPDNADHPLNVPDGWAAIPVSLAFAAFLKEFMH
ncbi:trna ligase [Coemansia biformis]|uniref:tRNA ligase n=1 Tax=Coemansia biformis TaxID=1286918 RepID=A0A9W8CUH4_9FUNG|nr:trna ligase [Coemansia biformis]